MRFKCPPHLRTQPTHTISISRSDTRFACDMRTKTQSACHSSSSCLCTPVIGSMLLSAGSAAFPDADFKCSHGTQTQQKRRRDADLKDLKDALVVHLRHRRRRRLSFQVTTRIRHRVCQQVVCMHVFVCMSVSAVSLTLVSAMTRYSSPACVSTAVSQAEDSE